MTADFYIMPILNPDGYEYSHTKDRSWRKNRRPDRISKCTGVDLNRNWGSHGVAYDNPCEVIYQGLSPFSEIETRNLADFIRSRRWDILSYLTIHAYSQMWMYPFAYTYDNAPDHEELSDLMREAKKSAPNYKIGSVAQLLYAVTGSSLDWAYDDMKIKYSFVIELKDMGHGFLLPSTKILPVASEVWTIYEYIISYVLNRETGYK
ncbi:unnamed protein product [Gordionus sp. m RMFG-2023]